MPSNWLLFDRIRALTKRYNIHQADRIYQDQPSLEKLATGSEFYDFNSQAAILDQTNLQINRMERYKDYEQMDQTGEISLSLDLYADEGCLSGDTIVPLLDGTTPTIAELSKRTEDFYVYSFDQKSGLYVSALAKNARVTNRNVIVLKIILENGCEIKATPDHLFMLSDGSFTRARDLKLYDGLKSIKQTNNHQPLTILQHLWSMLGLGQNHCSVHDHYVIGIEQNGFMEEVYDLEVPQYHCFAAGNKSSWVIVHNSLVDPERKHTVVIRARNRRLKKELEHFLFKTLLWDTQCRAAIRYLCKFGDMPFEIVTSQRRDCVTALRNINVYNFSRIETKHGDLVGFFQHDEHSNEPTYLHPWQVAHMRLTNYENIYAPYGKCLDITSHIWTPTGNKQLRDLLPGDEVYTFDGEKAIKTNVIKYVSSGVKATKIIKIKHRTIRCTPEHPILAIKKDKFYDTKYGRTRDINTQQYIAASELQHGDKLILPDTDKFLVESIISIEDGGDVEVGDIQVESDYHNFIANGIVVHNSILDGSRKAFKQLRLMEDAALIYRITRAPEKRKFTIPIGLIPPKEVPEYMAAIARQFKRQRFYNPTTGTFDERYSPLIQEDDFFLPRRPDGSGPDIDTLPGAENLDQIADIEYFKKKMISPLKIPFERVGLGEGAGQASEKSLSQSHAEFAKAVQWVQREVSAALTKAAIVHLALRGYTVDDLQGFDLSLSATSAMEELYRIETWRTRTSVMAELRDIGWFPKEWIVSRFTDMSMDEIQELKEMEVTESEGGAGGGVPGGLDLGGGADLGADIEGEAGALPELLTPEEESPDTSEVAAETLNNENKVLLEHKKQIQEERKRQIIHKWTKSRNNHMKVEDDFPFNSYEHLLENNELDNLTRGDGINEVVLIQPNIPEHVREEVIKENKEISVGENSMSIITEEITSDDLPTE